MMHSLGAFFLGETYCYCRLCSPKYNFNAFCLNMHHVIRSLKFTCFQLSNNFFKLSSNVPYQYKIKKISHWACLEDRMGQTYPICACTGTDHAVISSVHGTFCCSWKQGF